MEIILLLKIKKKVSLNYKFLSNLIAYKIILKKLFFSNKSKIRVIEGKRITKFI